MQRVRGSAGTFWAAVGRRLLLALGGSLVVALAVLTINVGAASAAHVVALGDVDPFHQCPPVGSDTGCAQLIVVNANGTTTVLVDPAQGPYEGVDDSLIGVQNNSGHSLSKLNLGSPSGADIMGFDGDGICTPSQWPAATTQTTPPGCPNPALGIGFGLTGYEGPGTYFSNISSNQETGTINFNPALRFGGSAYFALEEALTAGQLRASEDGPIAGAISVSGSTVQFQLTCAGKSGCSGKARLVSRVSGKKISGKLTGRGHLVVIGSAPLSIRAGLTATVTVKPNTTGKSMLTLHPGGFNATLRVVSGGATYSIKIVKLR